MRAIVQAGPSAALGLFLIAVSAVAAVSAGMDGYRAIGDDAEHALHARELLSLRPPLVGMPSSASDFAGRWIYHPGPMLFMVDLPGVMLLGPAAGLLMSVFLLTSITVVAIAFVGHRIGGPTMMMTAVAIALASYVACGGPALLFKPLNPFMVMLPLLLFILLSVGMAGGRSRMLPMAIVTGSLVVQANVVYAPAVAATALASAGMLWADRGFRLTWLTEAVARGVWWLDRSRRSLRIAAPHLLTGSVVVLCLTALLWPTAGPIPLVVVGGAVVLLLGTREIGRRRGARARANLTSDGFLSLMAFIACWALPLTESAANGGGNLLALLQLSTGPQHGDIAGPSWSLISFAFSPPLATLRDGFSPDLLLAARPWGVVPAVAVAAVAFAGRGRWLSVSGRLVVIATVASLANAAASWRSPYGDGPGYFWVPMLSCVLWAGLLLGLLQRFRPGNPWPSVRTLAVIACLLAIPLSWRPWPNAAEDPSLWAYPALEGLTVGLDGLPVGTYALVGGSGGDVDEVVLGLAAELEARGNHVLLANNSGGFDTHRLYRQGSKDVDGVLHIIPKDASFPPAGSTLVATYAPAGWEARVQDDLAYRLRSHIRAIDPSSLSPQMVAQAIYGRVQDACVPVLPDRPEASCLATTGFVETPERLLDLDPAVLLDLYGNGMAVEPDLPADLRADLTGLADLTALDVWLDATP